MGRSTVHYTDNKTTSFCGHATAVIRSSYETGKTVLPVSAKGMDQAEICMETLLPEE